MIQVQHLRKHFGAVCAVRDVSFTARDGAITGLLGSNGAGKTTTLRMICGVLTPQEGSIRIDDAAAGGDRRALQRRVGALLDHTGLYSRLTVRETLLYSGRLHGMSSAYLSSRVEEVISQLALQPQADRRTGGFSQGERMKTALGRALIHSPGNLLLDEPTNGLDVPSVRSLRSILTGMRDAGICVVFSSHVLEEVRTLCDDVVILSKGSVIAQGAPEEICRLAGTASLEDAFVKLTETEVPVC